jgi:hypothetical protein
MFAVPQSPQRVEVSGNSIQWMEVIFILVMSWRVHVGPTSYTVDSEGSNLIIESGLDSGATIVQGS